MEWSYAFASAVGTAHLSIGLPCQDASLVKLHTNSSVPLLICVVSDGAGTASHADQGSRRACDALIEYLSRFFHAGARVVDFSEQFARIAVEEVRFQLDRLAGDLGVAPRDLACTLAAAVVGADRAIFMQIGDGAIVAASRNDPGSFHWIFWPEKGEYANQTEFVTDPEALEHLQFGWAETEIDELAIFSDGLERLALHWADQTAHEPFFRPIFVPLRNATPGHVATLSGELKRFLLSDQVNERTDDDKTLIIASRRDDENNQPVPTPSTRPSWSVFRHV
jgi:hypothetical protein